MRTTSSIYKGINTVRQAGAGATVVIKLWLCKQLICGSSRIRKTGSSDGSDEYVRLLTFVIALVQHLRHNF